MDWNILQYFTLYFLARSIYKCNVHTHKNVPFYQKIKSDLHHSKQSLTLISIKYSLPIIMLFHFLTSVVGSIFDVLAF